VSGLLAAAVALILALLALVAVGLVLRNAVISRRGGVVECALRPGPGLQWRHGLAEYQRGRLCWYRSRSLRPRADATFDRAELRIVASRPPTASEAPRLGPGVVIAECTVGGQAGGHRSRTIELALPAAALTGLLAWLESSPQFHLPAS
jgi:Protein of unknown function (DUF2550)